MRINQDNKDMIEKLYLLTEQDKGDIRRFFEAFAFIALTDYMEDGWTNIPFFGNVKIRKLGTTFEGDNKRMQLGLDFEPEDSLEKNLGQIEDGEKAEIEEVFMNRIREQLSEYMR